MPHRVHQRKFGRETGHRKAMLRNLTLAVLRYERVKTTEAKAKEVRRFVDGMIVLGKDGSLAARRKAIGWLPEREIVEKVFTDLAERFRDRPSGFTRTTRLARRVGDSAPMMLLELMPGVEEQKPAAEAPRARRRLSLPGRRRRAAAGETNEAKPAGEAKAAEGAPPARRRARARPAREQETP